MPGFAPHLEVAASLTAFDWAVFGACLVATYLAIFFGSRRRASAAATGAAGVLDYLLMGRRLTLPLFVATLVASWYGGIYGVTRIAFESGIYNFVTQGVFWYAAYMLFALYLVPKVRSYESVTLPELVGRMFGPMSGRLGAVFNFLNVLPVAYAMSVGLFLQSIFGGTLPLNIAAGVALVALYTAFGGFRADVFTDVVQFCLMCAAVATVAALSVGTFGGWDFLRERLPEGHFSPLGGHSVAAALVWGFIAFSTLVDPSFYQRCFAARTEAVARRGILVSTAIWFVFDVCTTLGGMYARAVVPEADPSHAYVVYGLQLLPPGLRGLLLAGVLATILSTLDSFLFIAGTTLTYDLGPRRFRSSRGVQILGVASASVLSIALAVVFEGNVAQAWKTLGSYAAACLLLPMLFGYAFPGRIKDAQFVIGGLCGVVGTTAWRLAPHSGFWADVDALYAGMAATAAGLGVAGVLLPRRGPRAAPAIRSAR